jgi:hypothetical protein
MPTTSVRRRIFFVEALERAVRPELPPVLLRESGEGEQVGHRLLDYRGCLGEADLELVDDPSVLLVDGLAVGLGEDRAHHRRDEALGALSACG